MLEKIFVFDYGFKLGILKKIENETDGKKLAGLKKIISEASEFQNLLIDRKMKADKDLYDKIRSEKAIADKKIIKSYAEKLSGDDKIKINMILSKINSI